MRSGLEVQPGRSCRTWPEGPPGSPGCVVGQAPGDVEQCDRGDRRRQGNSRRRRELPGEGLRSSRRQHLGPWLPNSDTDLEAPHEIKAIQRLERDTTTMVLRADIPAGRRLQDQVFRTSVAAATRAGDELKPVGDLRVPDQLRGGRMGDGPCGFTVACAWTFAGPALRPWKHDLDHAPARLGPLGRELERHVEVGRVDDPGPR